MSIPIHAYTTEKKRTLKTIQECAILPRHRPANQRLGVQNKPIIHIEPDNVVIDELHLLLRIGDILVRNIVHEMVNADKIASRSYAQTAQSNTNMQQLLLFINTHCKVTFRVWEKRDPNGRPSGAYDWTSIMGSDMKKVLSLLPSKFRELLRPEIQEITMKVWNVS